MMNSTRTCPNCCKVGGLNIVYGLVGVDVHERAQRGELVIGGCIVSDDNPDWRCSECEHEWGRTRVRW